MLFYTKKSILYLVLFICLSSLLVTKVDSNKKQSNLIVLNEDTWTRLLKGEWMVDFYAPWCPACKSLKPEWDKLADWSDDLNINVAWIDVTENPGLSGRFMVSGLPTIYHVKDGVFRIYNGARNSKSMISFIDEKGWQSVEPVSRWLSPDSLQMTFVANSFKISMLLRDVHNHLVDNVGLPYYISYLIFALCTVTVGTILGLVIVFIIDHFWPPQYASEAQETSSRSVGQTKKDGGKRSKKQLDVKLTESDLEDSEAKSSSSSATTNQSDKGLVRRKKN